MNIENIRMTRLCAVLIILLVVCASAGNAQLTITRTEKLELPRSDVWSHPQFSPGGSLIYFTTIDGNGIWEYSQSTKSTRQITSDPKSGLAFDVSSDGKNLIYRRSIYDAKGLNRRQDVVLVDLAKGSTNVIASGATLSAPSFSENVPVYSAKPKIESLPTTASLTNVTVLGIEDTKIAINMNGTKKLLDPLGSGSYIWPVLSPDKQTLAAYEMDRGTFICDLRGNVIARLGRRDAPSWTRSGKWIVYMADKDDGNKLLSSDICAVSPDGKNLTRLTSTPGSLLLFPQCSPTENKIVCNSLDGSILVLEYEERQ